MNTNTLLLAGAVLTGVSVGGAATAATETAFGTFVFDFASDTNPTQTLSLNPFSGNINTLTGVELDFDSTANVTDTGTSDSSVSIRLDFQVITAPFFLDATGIKELELTADLLAQGFDKSLFVGGPVDFTLRAFSDEGNNAGTWFAGESPGPGGGLVGDLGGVALTYAFDDSIPIVPLPGSLPMLAMGGGALAVFARRKRKKH